MPKKYAIFLTSNNAATLSQAENVLGFSSGAEKTENKAPQK